MVLSWETAMAVHQALQMLDGESHTVTTEDNGIWTTTQTMTVCVTWRQMLAILGSHDATGELASSSIMVELLPGWVSYPQLYMVRRSITRRFRTVQPMIALLNA